MGSTLTALAETAEESVSGPCRSWTTGSRWRRCGRPRSRCWRGTRRSVSSPPRPSACRLRLLVGGVTYRHPGLLAKTVTTLDVLSGGRAELGLGAAWYEREHLGLGVPSHRSPNASNDSKRRSRSACRCGATTTAPMRACTTSWPRPCARRAGSSPRPRILIGGSGERKTLRLVAPYADACNIFGDATIAHKLDVLRRHCDNVGRDPSTSR